MSAWLLLAVVLPVAAASAAQEAVSPAQIRALLDAGRLEQAIESYNRYATDRKNEDEALLAALGQATLRQLAEGGHGETLTALALERLARVGDERARRALALAATGERTLMPQGLPADASLARLGDARAGARLVELASRSDVPNRVAVIDAIRDARVQGAGTALQALLDDPSPPVRAAAADALATLGVKDAIPRLRSLLDDRVLLSRVSAASALKRLGDGSADKLLDEWLTSELPDLRLMAATAYAGSLRDRGWSAAVKPLLADPNGTNRLRAAELLLRADALAARETLRKAAFDANPAVRAEAARLLASAPSPELPLLRRLLEDESAWVRLHAAGASAAAKPEKPTSQPAKK